MVTYLPISSPFIRFAGRYVDDAFGVAAGYNFFVFEAILVRAATSRSPISHGGLMETDVLIQICL